MLRSIALGIASDELEFQKTDAERCFNLVNCPQIGFTERFQPYTPPGGTSMAFKVAELKGNAVVRWEYRPGSTLFVVWQHGKSSYADTFTDRPWSKDYSDLFGLQANNTFLVKMAYWLNR